MKFVGALPGWVEPKSHLMQGVNYRYRYNVIACDQSVSWLLELYILATSMFISGRELTYDSAHSWRCYSATQIGDQATSTMT